MCNRYSKTIFLIFFDSEFVDIQNCMGYLEHKYKFLNKNAATELENAVVICEEYIKNLKLQEDKEIQEADITTNCSACAEKQAIVDRFKAQNQILQNELEVTRDEMQEKIQIISDLEASLKLLESTHITEIEDMKSKLNHSSDMNNNQKPKRAQNSALKAMTDSAKGGVYEVESILDHKITAKKKQQFLIKWKGYDHSHNTWEHRANLDCPKILDKYLKLKILK